MGLAHVDLVPVAGDLPPPLEALVLEAGRRIDAFVEARVRRPIYAFVPSDFRVVYGALLTVRERWLAPGDEFLEWGSGFGVVTMLAAAIGFSARGIEIEPDLVIEARRLARDFGAPVEFYVGSLLPAAEVGVTPPDGEVSWLDTTAQSAYEDLGMDLDELDVVFAFPWPGEGQVLLDVFEAHAAVGALLVTYEGIEGVQTWRKVR